MPIHAPGLPHAVLDRPWTYEVVELCIDMASKQLTMQLRNGLEVVTLLFSEVHQLAIDEGYDGRDSGMEILDMSSSGMETSRVKVSTFEQNPAIRFWASDVERVNQ